MYSPLGTYQNPDRNDRRETAERPGKGLIGGCIDKKCLLWGILDKMPKKDLKPIIFDYF